MAAGAEADCRDDSDGDDPREGKSRNHDQRDCAQPHAGSCAAAAATAAAASLPPGPVHEIAGEGGASCNRADSRRTTIHRLV